MTDAHVMCVTSEHVDCHQKLEKLTGILKVRSSPFCSDCSFSGVEAKRRIQALVGAVGWGLRGATLQRRRFGLLHLQHNYLLRWAGDNFLV